MHLPADDFPAIKIHDQLEVEEHPRHRPVTGPMVRAILAAIRRLRAPPSCA